MLGSDALAQENWGWSDHNRPFIAPNVSMIHQKSETFKWKITNLKSGALTSSPTFSPQPLCLDVVQLEFHSHLVQVDWVDCLLPFRTPFLVTSPQKNSQPRPPPQKKNDKKLNPEWKETTNKKTNKKAMVFWYSIHPSCHLKILMNCFSTTSPKESSESPNNDGKSPFVKTSMVKTARSLSRSIFQGFQNTLPEIHPNTTGWSLIWQVENRIVLSLFF